MLRSAQRGVAALGEAAEGVGLFAKSAVGANESAQRTVESMRADQEAEAAGPQPLSAKQLGRYTILLVLALGWQMYLLM